MLMAMKFKFLLSEGWLSLVPEDLQIQDRPLGLQLVLMELSLMAWTGIFIIHMDSQIECNTVEHTMQQIWLMQLML